MLLIELHELDQDPSKGVGSMIRQRGLDQQQRQRKLKRADDEPTSYVELHFYQPGPDGMPDEQNTALTVVGFDVTYDVSEDEYDGPHLFARGDVDADWHVASSFTWNGHQLNKLVPQMAVCCHEIEGEADEAFESGDTKKCMELLDKAVEDQLDLDSIQVPQKRYADSRSGRY